MKTFAEVIHGKNAVYLQTTALIRNFNKKHPKNERKRFWAFTNDSY